MKLRWQHKIYNEDFESKGFFEEYFDRKRDEVVEIKRYIGEVKNKEWKSFKNNQLEMEFNNVIAEIETELNRVLVEIEEERDRLK